MRIDLHACYILHQRSYRETSLIIEIFSRDYGKLSLVAKGVRQGKKNQRALLQPNQKLRLGWTIRGEMGILTTLEADGMNYNLNGSRLIASFYINELLMRLLHRHEPHAELFDAYDAALRSLHMEGDEQQILRAFEKQLLDSLGYGLVLDHDVQSGQAIEKDKVYFYDPESGPSLNPTGHPDNVRLSGSTLIALSSNRFTDTTHLQEARRLTRSILKQHLGSRPLASRELFRAYLRARDTS